ncbi:hypothetical protein B0H17DRAFT_274265 [Mycena rosella]|uniref:Uncharacterized protein n=1 Tax=Mycena rosella TaxID=1033263 RepID=A0AAD7DVL3_MYCRO|nr:hypothetical protein B0H17DRAFT_274265 [Mycena rosella]
MTLLYLLLFAFMYPAYVSNIHSTPMVLPSWRLITRAPIYDSVARAAARFQLTSLSMHSPDPDSSSSSPASESPPPEDHYQPSGTSSHILNLASHITSSFGSGSPSKRRLPGGSSFAAASSSRDPKSRRREDPRRGTWEGKEGGKREKEELVDNNVVEHLRKEIGDPFLETSFKAAS